MKTIIVNVEDVIPSIPENSWWNWARMFVSMIEFYRGKA